MPKNRYKINIDQVPLPFVNEPYNMLDAKPLRVPQPSPGLDKQQATLQLCTRADGEQKVKPLLSSEKKGVWPLKRKKNMTMYFQ